MLFNSVCSDACLKSYELSFLNPIDLDGPYCASNGEQYTTKQLLYFVACHAEEEFELEENCQSFYENELIRHAEQIEFHQNEMASMWVHNAHKSYAKNKLYSQAKLDAIPRSVVLIEKEEDEQADDQSDEKSGDLSTLHGWQ